MLGLQVQQRPDGIFINQDKYVQEILNKFDLGSVRTATTPYEAPKPMSKNEYDSPVNVHLYRSKIGSLMYLTASRPDIMFAVSACSRNQVTPTTSNLEAVKKIFKYLKGQRKLGLWYPRDSPFMLEAYSDSDYAGANKDRISITGGSVPTSTLTVPTGAASVPTGSPSVPADVPPSVALAGVSNKEKAPMVDEDILVKERTFKQMEEDRLGKEAAKRLHDEEQAQLDRQIAELQRKRQQEVLNSAMYYNEAIWIHIMAQVEANASLFKTLLGDDVSEDNFPAIMAALIKRKRQALAEKLA
nr:hypothetical protein [Tanacetum cinerariifolium]